MKVNFLNINLTGYTAFRNSGYAPKSLLSQDSFTRTGFVIKVSAKDFLESLKASGMNNFNILSVSKLLKDLNLKTMDFDTFNSLKAIYTKEKSTSALTSVLKAAYDPMKVNPQEASSFVLTCSRYYNYESEQGTTDIKTALLFTKRAMKYDIFDDDIDVANYLSNQSKKAKISKKLTPDEAVDTAVKLNYTKLNNGEEFIGANPEKINAFCDFYFGCKCFIEPKTALGLANLVMSDEDPFMVDYDKYDLAVDLLSKKINGKKIESNDVLKFCNYIFNQPIKNARMALQILKSEYNTTTSSARINMDAVLEMSKLLKDGFPRQYTALFEDYFGVVSHIQSNKEINESNYAAIAAAITRKIPYNLAESRYLPLDIEKLYKYYYNSDIPMDLIADLLVNSYLNNSGCKTAEKELKQYLKHS